VAAPTIWDALAKWATTLNKWQRMTLALHQARDRLGWITLLVPDAAVRRAAEDLCAEAAAAVDAHGGRAMFAEPRRR
jgi:hypothetical protein